MKKTAKEKDIQKSILDYLRLKKVFCYKNDTVGIYKKSTGRYIPSQSAGAPDIVCVIAGRYIGIEVKAKKGKQTESQRSFEINLLSAGGFYLLAYSLEDVVQALANMIE